MQKKLESAQLKLKNLDDQPSIVEELTSADYASLIGDPQAAAFLQWGFDLPHSANKPRELVVGACRMLMQALDGNDPNDLVGATPIIQPDIENWSVGTVPFPNCGACATFVITTGAKVWAVNALRIANAKKATKLNQAEPDLAAELLKHLRDPDHGALPALEFNLEDRAREVGFIDLPSDCWPSEASLKKFINSGKTAFKKGYCYVGNEDALTKAFIPPFMKAESNQNNANKQDFEKQT